MIFSYDKYVEKSFLFMNDGWCSFVMALESWFDIYRYIRGYTYIHHETIENKKLRKVVRYIIFEKSFPLLD